MQKLYTILVFMFVVGAGLAQSTKAVTIKGKVSGDTKGRNYVYVYSKGKLLDSAAIKNGKFIMKLPFTETYILSLVTQYAKEVSEHGYKPYYLLVDGKDNIKIEMDIEKGFYEARVGGSATASAYHSFIKERDKVYVKTGTTLAQIYGKSYLPKSDPLASKMSASRDSLLSSYLGDLISEFVKEHKNEYVAPYVLNNEGKSTMQIGLLEKSLQSLSGEMQQTNEGMQLAAHIRGVKNASPGATVKNFVLNDSEGKPVSLDQFKGKYVWIDFWASWCGPCKQAFPHMKEIYARYKDKGLEILGISADSKIEPWLKVLPTLQNPWIQVWDNKNIMSEFAVMALPTSFLIDPNGKILLKEIGYEPKIESEMEKKLAEIFGH